MLIGLVGVCAAGKSTLAEALRVRGFNARQISQEHSYVPDLWQRFSHADVLIYLDITLETLRKRLHSSEWPEWLFQIERERLRNAREHCALYLVVDDLTPEEVLQRVLSELEARDVLPGTKAR